MGRINNSGQLIPLLFIFILIFCLFWFTLLNVGKLMKDKIMMQNAADNSALTCSVLRARALNQLGLLNAILGLPAFGVYVPGLGFTIGKTSYVWWVEPPHKKIGKHTYKDKVKLARKAIKNLILLQDSIIKTYGGGTTYLYSRKIAKRQEIDSSNNETGADEIIPLTSFSLHLKRNSGDIIYLYTTEIYIPPTPITPEIWLWPIPYPYEIERKSKRWLQQDSKNFHKQMTKIIAYKRVDSLSNTGYPVGSGLLGLKKWPDIKTIASSCVYNKKGAMFPEENKNSFMIAFLEYIKAMSGGWYAQLVPVRKQFKH